MYGSVSSGVFADSHMWPLAHTAFRTFFPLLPTPVPVVLTPTSGSPRPAPRFYLPFWTFPFQVHVQVLGFQAWTWFPWQIESSLSESSPSSPHGLCHAHPHTREAWSGRGGEQGLPRPEGHPPAPSHARKRIPGTTQARSGQPCDRPPRVCWPFPSAEDGPLGTSLPGPRASLQLRPPPFSLCSLRVTPHRGAEISRPAAQPLAPPGRRQG